MDHQCVDIYPPPSLRGALFAPSNLALLPKVRDCFSAKSAPRNDGERVVRQPFHAPRIRCRRSLLTLDRRQSIFPMRRDSSSISAAPNTRFPLARSVGLSCRPRRDKNPRIFLRHEHRTGYPRNTSPVSVSSHRANAQHPHKCTVMLHSGFCASCRQCVRPRWP